MRRNRTPQEQEKHEAFERDQAAILAPIPEEFRAPIAALAWEQGHANGYSEVLIYLEDFVTHFEEPIKQFAKRLTTPSSN